MAFDVELRNPGSAFSVDLAPPPAVNLLSYVDQSFEGGTGTWEPDSNVTTVAQSSTTAKDGTYSLRITPTSLGTDCFVRQATPAVVVSPSSTYTIMASFYNTNAANLYCYVGIDWYNSSGSYVGNSNSWLSVTANTWTDLVAVVTSHASAAFGKVRLGFGGNASATYYYIDRVGLFAGTYATGDFTYSDAPSIPTDTMVGWWAADDITGVADGGAVTVWPSRAGGVLINAGNPTYEASWTNSKPAVHFDGTGDWMVSGIGPYLRNVTGGTVFVVAQDSADTMSFGLVHIARGGGSIDSSRFTLYSGGSSDVWWLAARRLDADAYADQGGVSEADIPDPSVIRMRYDWSTATGGVWQNQTQVVTASGLTSTGSTSDTTSVGLVVGGDGYSGWEYTGWIAEVIVYNSALDSTDIAAVEAYLATKYGIGGVTASFVGWGIPMMVG